MRISAIFPCFITMVLIFWIGSAVAGPGLLFPERLPKIVIDPGHGGADQGARGPTGHMEKNVTLELARRLAQVLEGHSEVILTRNDDYAVELRHRSAIANQANADLYISLHAGAGFLHATNVRTVYFLNSSDSPPGAATEAPPGSNRQLWRMAQKAYKEQSIVLADLLDEKLEKLSDGTGCEIQGAPLIVLEGAAMPAVLIEVGHITHPATEKTLLTDQGIADLAGAIGQGLKGYIDTSKRSRGDETSTDQAR